MWLDLGLCVKMRKFMLKIYGFQAIEVMVYIVNYYLGI
jgi:hypothetical protein